MKILRLHLIAFGPFTDYSLDFRGGSEGLHLVYGPNEAGKSTTLRALRALLYGIPRQSDDNHLHAYGDLRIGATLQFGASNNGKAKRATAATHELVRRKAVKSLYDATDAKPIDDAILLSALGGVDEVAFKNRFGIDHEQLLAGGRAIDEGKGDLGELLFAASAGIAHLGRVHESLDERAAALFKPRGQKLRINLALDALTEQKKSARDLALSDSQWRKQTEAIDALQEAKRELSKALQAAESTRERLRRFTTAIPLARQFAAEQAALDELGEVRPLAADFADRRRRAQEQARGAKLNLDKASAELARIEAQLAPLSDAPAILAYADDLEGLQSKVGIFTKAAIDRVAIVADQALQEERMAAIAASLGYVSASAIAPLPLATRVRISELAEQYPELIARRDSMRQAYDDATHRLARVQSELAELPAPADCEQLEKVVKRAQALAAIDEQLQPRRFAFDAAAQQADIDAARLLGDAATLAEAERRSAPVEAALEAAEESLTKARAALDQATTRLDEGQAQLESLAAEERRDATEADAPSPEALATARSRRNESWRQLRAALFADDLPKASEEAESLKQGIHAADDLADSLLRSADYLVRRSEYQRKHAELVQRIADRTKQREAARVALAAAEAAWQSLWQPVGVAARSPREMRAWLAEHRRLCDEGARLRIQGGEIADAQARVDVVREELEAALNATSGDTLRELVQRGEQRAAAENQARQSRLNLERQRASLARDIASCQEKSTEAEADLQAWQAQWSAAIEPLGCATRSPKQAQETLRALSELQAIGDKQSSLATRIAGIDRDAADLVALLSGLIAELAPDLPRGPNGSAASREWVESSARELRRRATAARDAAQTRKALVADRMRWQAEHADARCAMESADALLDALCQEAGAQSVDELPALEASSARRVEHAARLRDLESRLLVEAAGAPLDEFLAQLVGQDADAIAAEAAECGRRIAELQVERERIHGELVLAERELSQKFGGESAAADAAAEEASLRAAIEDDVARFVQLKLAGAVLRRSIDRYRQAHQAPLLARAGELFRTLTAGAFDRLDVDYDEINPVVVGVRAGGKQRIRTAGMSAGTRDQLYLALRIASVEEYIAKHEPIPFIVDDVLQQFDDQRAVAALQAFAELSRKTQVIFFTHHEHLLRLAADHLPDNVCFTQRLDRAGSSKPAA